MVKSPFADTIYKVDTTPDAWLDDHTRRTPLTYDQWAALGRPAPLIYDADEYTSLPWSTAIYAVTYWPDIETYADPTNGIDVVHLTFAQWSSAGRPAASKGYWVCEISGCQIQKFATSSELFMYEPNAGNTGYAHKLTYAQWAAAGFPPVTITQPIGFYKLPWTSTIFAAAPSDVGPSARSTSPVFDVYCESALTAQDWARYGYPTPRVVSSMKNDRFIQQVGNPNIAYDGYAGYGFLTFAEWQRLGSPAPVQVTFPLLAESAICHGMGITVN